MAKSSVKSTDKKSVKASKEKASVKSTLDIEPVKPSVKYTGKCLVIVESPSKAKTINKYLGKDFIVEATVGHIKNLPKSKISIDLEKGNYEATYDVIPGKEKVIETIKNAARNADKVYIATDPDREGESIADDIADEVRKVNKKIVRVLFNEITKKGVEKAMKEPLEINMPIVESQMARRVMDRILGYKVSPFLWKTFYFGLSAGRVQSVALKLIAEKEKEIQAFKAKEYWSIDGLFSKLSGSSKPFGAKLYKINDDTLKFDGEKPNIANLDEAHAIIESLKNNKYKIIDIQVKEVKRNAPAPFTTSVLQQTASTRMGFSPKRTMAVAQKLYEGIEVKKGEGNVGLITYMRTDSTRLSPEAVDAAREYIKTEYGKEYMPEAPKIFANKSKNAQDAHEAIRPTDVNIHPDMVMKLGKEYHALYDLIWKRFVASQMSQAILDQKTVIIRALSPKGDKNTYLFKATGSVITFSGFLKVYEDAKDEDDTPADEDIALIPADLNIGDNVKVSNLRKDQHFTSPPARYTESSLIKQLDKLGIGRPSTFAMIVSTVLDRKYVDLVDRRLFATNLGMTVSKILDEYFPDVINVDFTAKMEEELDTIANGEATYKQVLDDFYLPFEKDLLSADSHAKEIKERLTERTDKICPDCGAETGAHMVKKWGRNGQFYACENYPKCKCSLPLVEDPEANKKVEGINCDLCGAPMVLKVGPYGKFYGCSNYPKCKGIKPITLGIKCPKCNEGEVVERRGGKGRVKRAFFACTRYPDCDFISNGMPVIQNCTECDSNYLVKKVTKGDGEFLECPKCKAKYDLPKDEKVNEKVTEEAAAIE